MSEKKYEYNVLDYERPEGYLPQDLNGYGAEGWELVSILPMTLNPTFLLRDRGHEAEVLVNHKMIRLIFKRECN